MLVDDDAATVVRLVMEMGRSAGLEVVALGVATDDHVAALTALGCQAAQGGHFATLSADQLLEYLRSAPTEDPALAAQVIPLDSRRRSTPTPS
jgi:EAL domain-containing protein (putative c-di-GMP-specific phosphodiesterase class I)